MCVCQHVGSAAAVMRECGVDIERNYGLAICGEHNCERFRFGAQIGMVSLKCAYAFTVVVAQNSGPEALSHFDYACTTVRRYNSEFV